MSAYIKPEHLSFLEEAKQIFEKNSRRETHQNEEGTLIALRFGEDRDCINIFELGEEVAFFTQQTDPSPNPRLEVIEFAKDMEIQIGINNPPEAWHKYEGVEFLKTIKETVKILSAQLEREDKDKVAITKACANIACFAMMLADNEGEHL